MSNEDRDEYFTRQINKFQDLLAGTGYSVLIYQEHRRFDEVYICNNHKNNLCLRFISCDDNDYDPGLFSLVSDFAMIMKNEKEIQKKIQDELDLHKVSDKAVKNRKL